MTSAPKPKGTRITRFIAAALRHPILITLVGAGVFLSGLFELLEELNPNFEHWLGVHHGIMLVGFVTTLKGIVESVEGLQTVSERFEDESN